MTERATHLQVLEFFGSAPLTEVEQVNRLARLLLKGRRAKADTGPAPPSIREEAPSLLLPPPKKPESIGEKALEVLEEAGRPMSGGELADAINGRFGASHSKASVVGGISRLVRAQKTFCRAGKGQYGLIGRDGTRPPDIASDGPAPGESPRERRVG